LAERLGARFVDGDSLHPAANVAKMAAGTPLDDDDRWPWLARVRAELRTGAPVVIACSALKRRYRDLLRHADGVRFVFLDLTVEAAHARAAARTGHFMSAAMVDSQFAALERPTADESDVFVVDATAPVGAVVAAAVDGLQRIVAGVAVASLRADGGTDRDITDAELAAHVAAVVNEEIIPRGVRRVLLVPPDHTRLHSRAGVITVMLLRELEVQGCEVGVLPALGTHMAMSAADAAALFHGGLAADRLLVHEWRTGLHPRRDRGRRGECARRPLRRHDPVAVDAQLFEGWDLVVSIGQVVPTR
jgi:gluconokinase